MFPKSVYTNTVSRIVYTIQTTTTTKERLSFLHKSIITMTLAQLYTIALNNEEIKNTGSTKPKNYNGTEVMFGYSNWDGERVYTEELTGPRINKQLTAQLKAELNGVK